jgi:hypothetical protein
MLKYPNARIVAVARKDRAAIGFAGRGGLAYWYNDPKIFANVTNMPKIVSTTYYMNEYPQWVKDFNNQLKTVPNKYFGPDVYWNLALPYEKYYNRDTPRSVIPPDSGYITLDPVTGFPKQLIYHQPPVVADYSNINTGPQGDMIIAGILYTIILLTLLQYRFRKSCNCWRTIRIT